MTGFEEPKPRRRANDAMVSEGDRRAEGEGTEEGNTGKGASHRRVGSQEERGGEESGDTDDQTQRACVRAATCAGRRPYFNVQSWMGVRGRRTLHLQRGTEDFQPLPEFSVQSLLAVQACATGPSRGQSVTIETLTFDWPRHL